MKIGLDFDGVIADCGQLKSEAARALYGVSIPPADFKKELVIGQGILTLEQYRELQKQIYGTRQLGLQMIPVPEALSYLKQLTTQHQVRIVTSRGDVEIAIAQEWVKLQDPELALEWTSVGYQQSKAEALRGYDIFVDDDLDKLIPLVSVVPHRFLFSWGYNDHIQEGTIAHRVSSWTELYNRIMEIDPVPHQPGGTSALSAGSGPA